MMNALPASVSELVDHIHNVDAWMAEIWSSFSLQHRILSDIASFANEKEADLPPVDHFFAEVARERLSVAPTEKWTWRSRSAIQGYKSPYLEWLRSQWASGRWQSDQAIHHNARNLLDPRFARFESVKYQEKSDNPLGQNWPSVVKNYREVVDEEARRRGLELDRDSFVVSGSGVEKFVMEYLKERGWLCRSIPSRVGNIITMERSIAGTEYVFRASLSITDKALLDHFDGWISVNVDKVDPLLIKGGPSATVGASIGDLLIPSSIYYLTHDRDKARIKLAFLFFCSVLAALTRPLRAV